MDIIVILKALSNETRYRIVELLKDPEANFGPQRCLTDENDFYGGVCVGSIQEKAGLAQSVISSYLTTLQKAGLLESKRIGQWTYYRRNEKQIREFIAYLGKEL